MTKEEVNTPLPYHADIKILEKILTDLKTSGKDGIKLETLWANIGAMNNKHRSYTLNLGKFLGLVDGDSSKVWLTDFGIALRYMNQDEKNQKLARKLFGKYLTMFKWIYDNHEMRSNELKAEFIGTWGSTMSSSVLDRTITTFLNYCNWIGIISYQGRGNQAKAIITDFGKRMLDSNPEEMTPPTTDTPTSKGKPKKESPLSKDAIYPIIIQTNDRGDFEYDIQSESDWAVIDSVITAMKERWKKSMNSNQNYSNRIKEEDSRKPT